MNMSPCFLFLIATENKSKHLRYTSKATQQQNLPKLFLKAVSAAAISNSLVVHQTLAMFQKSSKILAKCVLGFHVGNCVGAIC